MRTKFTILVMALFMYSGSQAQTQVPNGGFENWNDSVPAWPLGWDTYDHMLQKTFSSPTASLQMTMKETSGANVYSGTSSVRLQTVNFPGFGPLPGGIALDTLGFDGQKPVYHGTPFTGRPATFNGAVKYQPAGSDTGIFKLYLTKWDATGDSELIIGQVFGSFGSTSGAFATFSDSLQYLSSASPDSLQLHFTSSKNADTTNIGTYLWIDDLGFTYPTTGLVHFNVDDAVKIFPVPASSTLNIVVDNYMIGDKFSLFDLSGRLVVSNIIQSATSVIDVSAYAEGAYLLRLNDNRDKMVYQNKVVIAK